MSKKFSKPEFLYRAYKYRFIEDKPELSYLLKSIKQGDFVLDIGAHKGGYLHWIRKAAGSIGKVVAFEPQPILYRYLATGIKSFGYSNVDLYHAGVSSKAGSLELFVPKAEGLTSPGATFEKRDNTQGHTIPVPVFKIDELLANRETPISFIKIDVEGHELKVFKGAEDLLRKDKPKLLFECENRHLNNQTVFDIFNYLSKIGYQGCFFKNGKLMPLEKFDPERDQTIDSNREIQNKKSYCNNFAFEFIDP
ncbi:MAG: FkbM family methyltransferase [Cytophagia bacterium]|nr:FkbM family methyltransferase [Cytophagia bacterium]